MTWVCPFCDEINVINQFSRSNDLSRHILQCHPYIGETISTYRSPDVQSTDVQSTDVQLQYNPTIYAYPPPSSDKSSSKVNKL